MLSKKVEKALNAQILLEAESSHYYLSMASWAESEGYNGTAEFLYTHSDEERIHMIKLVRFINERGGTAVIPSIKEPASKFKSLTEVFGIILKHEELVTSEINKVVDICLSEKDYTTHNFMQWYVAEQLEEEALAKTNVDRLKLMGGDKGALYLFDRDLSAAAKAKPSEK
ncbi:MAG: ferritin [Bacteroidetes bacterium]|nr:ferritin [Bacteroidota bacterium]